MGAFGHFGQCHGCWWGQWNLPCFTVSTHLESFAFTSNKTVRCLTGSHNCHDDAVCTYATGSTTPQCTCRRGFVGDGFTCSDLDECATFRHDCTFDETCVNTEGGFYCKKRENADGSRLTLPGQACFDGTNTCHHLATCVPDNNLQGYDCICHEGFYGNGGGIGPGAPGCHDVDECLTVNECNSQGSTCVNTFGSYVCKPVGPVCAQVEPTTCESCKKLGPKCVKDNDSVDKCKAFGYDIKKDACAEKPDCKGHEGRPQHCEDCLRMGKACIKEVT